MNEMNAKRGKVVGYGLVRVDGKPVFDDINNIPDPIWGMLTKQEQEEIISVRNASR